jgi:hypothetical protein
LKVWKLAESSFIAKYRDAYMGAGGVPIAVPVSCSQYVSSNLKTLFFMMIVKAAIRASRKAL